MKVCVVKKELSQSLPLKNLLMKLAQLKIEGLLNFDVNWRLIAIRNLLFAKV